MVGTFSVRVTYTGLESCIQKSPAHKNEGDMTRGDGITTDSIDELEAAAASCCSSSNKNAFGSVSSHWKMKKWFEQELEEWGVREIPPQGFYKVTEHPIYSMYKSDVEPMRERFAKLLLGDDITGGRKALSTSLALSNAITNLAGQ